MYDGEVPQQIESDRIDCGLKKMWLQTEKYEYAFKKIQFNINLTIAVL